MATGKPKNKEPAGRRRYNLRSRVMKKEYGADRLRRWLGGLRVGLLVGRQAGGDEVVDARE